MSETITLRLLFLPCREILHEDLIDSLDYIFMKFPLNTTITNMQFTIESYINNPENAIIKLGLLEENLKIQNPLLQLYYNSSDKDLNQIKELLKKNVKNITAGDNICIQGLFEPLTPTIICYSLKASEISIPEDIKDNSIIICEYYQKNSLFSLVESAPFMPKAKAKPNLTQLTKYNIGLKNLFNSCYINACIQCLSASKEIAEYFILKDFSSDMIIDKPKNELIISFAEIINCFWTNSNAKDLNIQAFCDLFKKINPTFENYDQQDLSEFLSAFINNLIEGFQKDKSIINELLQGKLKSISICSKCKTQISNEEKFIHLSLPIKKEETEVIQCNFHFYNQTNIPFTFNYKIDSKVTINQFKKSIAKKLHIPLSSFYLYLYNPNTFVFNCIIVNDNIIMKELELSMNQLHLILLAPYLFNIRLDTIMNNYFTQIDENNIFSNAPNNNDLIINTNDLSNYIKIIIKHKALEKQENQEYNSISISIIPNVFCVEFTWSLYEFYRYLINYYKKILSEINHLKFNHQKEKSLPQIKLQQLTEEITDPFILLFEKIQYLNYLLNDTPDYIKSCQGIIMPFNSKCSIEDFFKKYCTNKNNHNKNEMVLSIAWNNKYQDKIKGINLNIQHLKSSLDTNYTIFDYFKAFFSKETLSDDNKVYCLTCQSKQLIEKQYKITKLPEMLIIIFKRPMQNKVIDTLISYPLNGLNLSEYLEDSTNNSKYDLFAVANHNLSLTAGHYTAYTKNYSTGEWNSYSDKRIERITEKDIISKHSYVLFYKKIND